MNYLNIVKTLLSYPLADSMPYAKKNTLSL
jgi:hypothetical protein